MTEPQATVGFAHFLAQTDEVGRALLVILLGMSVLSWAIVAVKALAQFVRRRRSAAFLRVFWNAASLDDVAAHLAGRRARDPFSHLVGQALGARAHHERYGASRLAEAGNAQDFVTRTMRQVLDDEGTRAESGLTTLATIGATAPFVGLFGTVWGVYHALVAIGLSGAGTLDKVAGPVGEALIMTGIGLAVAIPAVVAYNAFVRANRVLDARLDSFAFELLTFLAMGMTMRHAPDEAAGKVRPLRRASSAA